MMQTFQIRGGIKQLPKTRGANLYKFKKDGFEYIYLHQMYFQVHLLSLGSGLGQNTIQLSFCRSNCTRELIKTNSKNTLHIQFTIYNILRQSKCLLLLLRTEDTKTIKKKLLKPLKVDIELHNPRRIIKEFSTINLFRSVLF